jgi:hypothetical protein
MFLIVSFIAVIFAFFAFSSNFSPINETNPLIGYFFHQANIITDHLIIFTVVFIIVLILISRIVHFNKAFSSMKNYFNLLIQSIITVMLGFLMSYFLLLIIACIQLNLLSFVINMNPKLLGIKTDRITITKILRNNNVPPQIIASDNNQYKELVAIAQTTTGIDNFYGKYILASVPNFFVLPTKKIGSTLLLDNTLIISEINSLDLQAISPIIGFMFVKRYFATRGIKYYPQVFMMDKNEYYKYRDIDFNKKVQQIASQAIKMDQGISSFSAEIQKDKNEITYNQTAVKDLYSQKNKRYNACFSEGYYVNGKFFRNNSKEFCKNLVLELENKILLTNNTIDDLNKKLIYFQNQLEIYKFYSSFFNTQVKSMVFLKKNIPSEFGAFTPNNTIKIVIDNTSAHAIADYFETLTHEYLHYSSYVDNKSFSCAFFEEGFTEYFARMAIKNELNTSTNLGYPVFVKIISQMTKRIPETDLADIYFTKDQAALENILNKVYGDNFYKDNLITFETLQYTSSSNQMLQLANKIMEKIGGPELKEKDLITTYSNL